MSRSEDLGPLERALMALVVVAGLLQAPWYLVKHAIGRRR